MTDLPAAVSEDRQQSLQTHRKVMLRSWGASVVLLPRATMNMTRLDRFEDRPAAQDGYWPSAWPAECGGDRRQKAASGTDAAAGTASVTGRRNGRWNVMYVEHDDREG